ncbi:MAG: queuosine synthesis [Deltaproteobacteria bacterium SG8_13]|nr:MAG: queuosine synthesis [Deltaproteobacteria bacterium SG8_13]
MHGQGTINTSDKPARALGLCSGGLDSMMSALVLRTQGIAVEWVTFETPFFSAEKARRASLITGVPLTVENITAEYLEMLKDPPAGYGKYMNPCMDCHTMMFRLAGKLMRKSGFDFLFSGEVLGQRPMSQTRPSLRYVEKHSGLDGYILRPLSARKLPETIPEKNGLVDRSRLLDISGRSRKPQIALAKHFGISEFPAPAGGCLLTDKGFSRRLSDLFRHRPEAAENEFHLLRHGRHFRLNPQNKLIVGRTEKDNEKILQYHDPLRDTVIKVKLYAGPIAVLTGAGGKQVITLAASICAGYSRAPNLASVEVDIKAPDSRQSVNVLGLPPSDVKKFLV